MHAATIGRSANADQTKTSLKAIVESALPLKNPFEVINDVPS